MLLSTVYSLNTLKPGDEISKQPKMIYISNEKLFSRLVNLSKRKDRGFTRMNQKMAV